MPDVTILGAAGAIGRNLGHELDRRGKEFRAIGRNRAKLQETFSNRVIHTADLSDPQHARAALENTRTAIYTVGLDYTQFHQHPVLMRNAVEACVDAGVAQMLVVTSVYSYGWPQSERVSEDHPRNPQTRKGRFRKEQEDIALQAHAAGRLKVAILHLPDFYGPYAENSLAHLIFQAASKHEKANWLGSVDIPHEFVFVPDAARTMMELIHQDAAWGQRWNLGGPGTITGREFMISVYREYGEEPKWRTVPKLMLRAGGLFNPLFRELVEMYYLGVTPVILDDSKLKLLLREVRKTPYPEGIRETAAFYSRAD